MTKTRKAEIAKAIDRWLKYQLVLKAAGMTAQPRNDLERLFVDMQHQLAAEQAAVSHEYHPDHGRLGAQLQETTDRDYSGTRSA